MPPEILAPDVDPASAVIACADRVRAVIEMLATADVPPAVLADVTELLDIAGERLRPHLRPSRQVSPLDVGRIGGRLFGPVMGPANPVAPPLVLHQRSDRVEGRCTLSQVYEGPRGYVHGGVSALLMDEVSAKVPELTGVERVTGTLSLRFHRPVPLDVPLLLTAQRRPGEHDVVDATIATEADPATRLVSAEAVFVRLRPEQIERFRAGSGAAGSAT